MATRDEVIRYVFEASGSKELEATARVQSADFHALSRSRCTYSHELQRAERERKEEVERKKDEVKNMTMMILNDDRNYENLGSNTMILT